MTSFWVEGESRRLAVTENSAGPIELGLADLVELLGLPTQPELRLEGIRVDTELYLKLVVRLARRYLEAVHLALVPLPDDRFRLEPLPGEDWQDAAYWLGTVANLEANQVVINTPQDLLRWQRPPERPHPDLASAVRANLWLLKAVPRAFGLAPPDQALRQAAAQAAEVMAVRRQGGFAD